MFAKTCVRYPSLIKRGLSSEHLEFHFHIEILDRAPIIRPREKIVGLPFWLVGLPGNSTSIAAANNFFGREED